MKNKNMATAKGFSLIELLITVALITILVSLSLVNTRSLHQIVVHTEIDLLHTACSYLQRLAMAKNQIQEMVFDEAEHSYSYNDKKHILPSHLCFGVLPEAKGPPSSPTTLIKNAITFVNKTITFYPEGIISAGTLYVLNTQNNSLYAISSGIANTSFLRTYRYDGKWHLLS